MNLQSKKARIPIAALGVTALCTAGLGVVAGSAFAADLTLNPTSATATITDIGVGTDPKAQTAYGLKFGGVPAGTLYAAVTGPVGGSVLVDAVTDSATPPTPQASDTFASIPVTATLSGFGTTLGTFAATKTYYLASTVPGSYTIKFFSDGNGNTTFDSGVDTAAPDFALGVKDVTNATSDASDNLSFTVTTTPSIDLGELATTKVSISDLSTTDARGNVAGKTYGALGKELGDITTVAFSGVAGALPTADTSTVFDGTYFKLSNSAGPTAAGTMLSTAKFGSLGKTASTTVNDNSVTALGYTPAPSTTTLSTNAVYTSSTVTRLRSGVASVTYKVKATGASSVPQSGKTVFFRLSDTDGGPGSGIDLADLTTSSGAPDAQGDVGVTTDSDGIASLTVTVPAAKAVAARSFGIQPRSNSFYATGGSGIVTTATFEDAAPTTITAMSKTAVVGDTATLTGKVADQFGEPIAKAGVPAVLAHVSGSPYFSGAGSYPVASDGTFSATVTDVASNTTVRTDTFTWTVGSAVSPTLSLSWRLSVTPATTSIATLDLVNTQGTSASADDTALANSTLPIAAANVNYAAALATSSADNSATLLGTVKDSSGNVLPYASVTYSGSDGVYFVNSSGKYVKTLDAATDASGNLYDGVGSVGSGIEVVFTKAGSATITAVAGAATAAVTVPVRTSDESWKVTAQDAKSKPSQSVTLLGKIEDGFGNPVVGRQVTLSLDTISAGSFSGTDANSTLAGFQVVTDSSGVWSTPFTSTANQNGNAVVTATLVNLAGNANLLVNPPASTFYANTGITVTHGEYQDTAAIQVVDPTTGIAVTNQLLGGGKAQISGTAEAGASVDLYARVSGESGFELVKSLTADPTGMWGIGSTINKTTSYFARSGGKTSDTVTATVFSVQTVTAKALGKGVVRFTVLGTPNVKGVVNIYLGDDRIGHVATDKHGDVTVEVLSKVGNKILTGRRTFKIYFVAPGTSTKGTSLTGTVK